MAAKLALLPAGLGPSAVTSLKVAAILVALNWVVGGEVGHTGQGGVGHAGQMPSGHQGEGNQEDGQGILQL